MQRMLLAPMFLLVACGGTGRVSLSWQINDAGGTDYQCATGEVVVVSVDGRRFTFDCTDGLNSSSPVATGTIPWGTYDVTVSLYSDSSLTTVEDQQVFTDVEIDTNLATDIHVVKFIITPTTGAISFSWTLSSPDAGGSTRNCEAGEKISVSLGGGIPAFLIDCTTAQPYVASDIPAGNYSPTYTLQYQGAAESGPGEAQPFVSDDTGGPDTYADAGAIPVTAGGTADYTILFYVDRCSFNGGSPDNCAAR